MPGWPPSLRRALIVGTTTGLLLALAVEVGATYLGRNWHELIPGRVYRCAQLSPEQIRQAVERYGIRTVVNLRGCCPDFDWYRGESRATCNLDVSQEDVTLSATRLPAEAEVRRLVEIFEQTQYPILFHCRQGVDRTGLVAALALLLTTDTSLPAARQQLSLRYGHIAIGPTAAMGEFLELYEDWLHDRGRTHDRAAFREWAVGSYCPAHCRGRLEMLDPPTPFKVGVPTSLRVRAHNTSVRPWRLTPGTETGVHVRYEVSSADLKVCVTGRAGLFDAVVAPGDFIDLTLALPAIDRPGQYAVRADLIDRNRCGFSQLGSEPLEIVIHVIESGSDE